jgi:lipopolysaccharide biosynthesis glycosyltransferase
MSTEFACSRFLTPLLARTGWALFMDCDMLCRAPLRELFAMADDRYAVMCVQHVHVPTEAVKMDGQEQTLYARKNWSSLVLYNCDHPANERLTLDAVNTLPGRDLHRFCWLRDEEIGALPVEWNWLASVSDAAVEPKMVHYTLGAPNLPGYEHSPYADEWRAERRAWLEAA